jgi:hypothetical protein
MDASVILSVLAVGVSGVALFISSLLTARQLRLLRQTNHVPAIIDLLTEYRRVEFHDRYNYVVTRLRKEHDPELGIFGLPEPAKSAVLDISYSHQTFAALFGLKILDESALPVLNWRILKVWDSIEPYATVERRRNPDSVGIMLTVLQGYVENSRRSRPRRLFSTFSRMKASVNVWRTIDSSSSSGKESEPEADEKMNR